MRGWGEVVRLWACHSFRVILLPVRRFDIYSAQPLAWCLECPADWLHRLEGSLCIILFTCIYTFINEVLVISLSIWNAR
jgi:hypothetical protein